MPVDVLDFGDSRCPSICWLFDSLWPNDAIWCHKWYSDFSTRRFMLFVITFDILSCKSRLITSPAVLLSYFLSERTWHQFAWWYVVILIRLAMWVWLRPRNTPHSSLWDIFVGSNCDLSSSFATVVLLYWKPRVVMMPSLSSLVAAPFVANISWPSLLFAQELLRPYCVLEENITRKLLSLSLDLFFKILLFQVTFLIFFSVAVFSPYFLLVGLLSQYVALFQSMELVKV